jgi:ascorbate-specific PTS system EIIC-type component UlaA
MTNRRGYTILGWLVWQIGSRIVKRKVRSRFSALRQKNPAASVGVSGVRRLGQTMAENRVKLGLAGAVLLAVGGGLAALAARSGGGSGDDE